mmetsp:Transcript_41447/g.75850  ORF Transcript_41447/g.75850 Transcript_41447/m.75850 type:complete len:80 (+) Transcript_41447:38-277(+)
MLCRTAQVGLCISKAHELVYPEWRGKTEEPKQQRQSDRAKQVLQSISLCRSSDWHPETCTGKILHSQQWTVEIEISPII